MEQLTIQPITLTKARVFAERACELLQAHCEKIHIAGSVRRGEKKNPEGIYVKDVEIVSIPKKEFVSTDLFGGGHDIVSPGFTDTLQLMTEEVIKGNPEGRYMQMILRGGVKMDLFMPRPEDYYRGLTIRTGSAEFSFKTIASRWSDLGWVGTNEGLRRKSDCCPYTNPKTGKIAHWKVINNDGEQPPSWASERDFFEWLGVRWRDPGDR